MAVLDSDEDCASDRDGGGDDDDDGGGSSEVVIAVPDADADDDPVSVNVDAVDADDIEDTDDDDPEAGKWMMWRILCCTKSRGDTSGAGEATAL